MFRVLSNMLIIFVNFSLRNMTWGGKQGFQTPIEPETFLLKDMGVFGNAHSERGLTCALLCGLGSVGGTDIVVVVGKLSSCGVLLQRAYDTPYVRRAATLRFAH